MKTTLPADSGERKNIPLRKGCLNYFPAALAGVARWSKIGNEKHNPGEPLHHARGKSMDHEDCVDRHLTDIEDIVAAFERRPEKPTAAEVAQLMDEADALAWRALAISQELHERYGGAPLAPAARLPAGKPVTFREIPYAGQMPVADLRSAGSSVFSDEDFGKR